MTTKITREKPETKTFRKQILRLIGKGKTTAYDIAKSLAEKGMSRDEWHSLYKKVLYNLKALENSEQIELAGEKEGQGSIPKRVYRRKR